jgi:hypothetical protein
MVGMNDRSVIARSHFLRPLRRCLSSDIINYMPKRSSRQSVHPNVDAHAAAQAATGATPTKQPRKRKNPAAVALGRLGGRKGGKARALKLSQDERSRIAREAAKIRWAAHRSDAEAGE